MKKHDLSSVGLSIIAPRDPNYDVEFQRFGLGTPAEALASKPVSVILENLSNHSIVAFALHGPFVTTWDTPVPVLLATSNQAVCSTDEVRSVSVLLTSSRFAQERPA